MFHVTGRMEQVDNNMI